MKGGEDFFHVGETVECVESSGSMFTKGKTYIVENYASYDDDPGWNSVRADDGVLRIVNHDQIKPFFRRVAAKGQAKTAPCTCPIQDLMMRGCQCGQMQRERAG